MLLKSNEYINLVVEQSETKVLFYDAKRPSNRILQEPIVIKTDNFESCRACIPQDYRSGIPDTYYALIYDQYD